MNLPGAGPGSGYGRPAGRGTSGGDGGVQGPARGEVGLHQQMMPPPTASLGPQFNRSQGASPAALPLMMVEVPLGYMERGSPMGPPRSSVMRGGKFFLVRVISFPELCHCII